MYAYFLILVFHTFGVVLKCILFNANNHSPLKISNGLRRNMAARRRGRHLRVLNMLVVTYLEFVEGYCQRAARSI